MTQVICGYPRLHMFWIKVLVNINILPIFLLQLSEMICEHRISKKHLAIFYHPSILLVSFSFFHISCRTEC